MKHTLHPLSALIVSVVTVHAQSLLQIPNPGFEALPESGMVVFKSPGAQDALIVKTAKVEGMQGTGCLEIDLPVAAYASVSFPLERSTDLANLKISYKSDLGMDANVKIGIQSYTMQNGFFESIDFKPLFDSTQITSFWQTHQQEIKRAEGASHWQLSIGITGPGTLWIDGLDVVAK